jgi:ADP-glucose pyrophosphorylase
MPNVHIEEGVFIRNAIIGEGCTVRSGAVIGGSFREGEKREIAVVGKNHEIVANQVVKPGEVI